MDRIDRVHALLTRAHQGLLKTARQVPDDRWRSAPSQGGWSAAEILAHLAMVEEAIASQAEELIAGPPKHVPVWKRSHLPVRLAAWRGFRVKTPIPLDPKLVADRAESEAAIDAARQHSLRVLAQNRERDLSPYRFPHPFFGSLNLYHWFETIGYHELRHTKQIRALVRNFQH